MLCPADQPRNAASCAASQGCISGARACLALGGEAVAAGLRVRRWERTARYELTLVHAEDCPVRRDLIAPHGIAEAATAAVPGLVYVRDAGGGSGGWVLARDRN